MQTRRKSTGNELKLRLFGMKASKKFKFEISSIV